MKKYILLIFFLITSHCSFDNKTGIWNNSNTVDLKKTDRFKDFETLYTKEKSFYKIIVPDKTLNLILDPINKNKQWSDEFYQESNNLDNFEYNNLNEIIFKSKKISRYTAKDKILFDGENIIATDNGSTPASGSKAITINVTDQNDAPVAIDDTAITTINTAKNNIVVLDDDTDEDGDTLNIQSVTYSGTGTVTHNGTKINYTPPTGVDTLTENITYVVTDGNGGTDTGLLSVSVVTLYL